MYFIVGRPEIGQWKIYTFSFLIHLLIGRASKYLVLDFFVFNLLFFFCHKKLRWASQCGFFKIFRGSTPHCRTVFVSVLCFLTLQGKENWRFKWEQVKCFWSWLTFIFKAVSFFPLKPAICELVLHTPFTLQVIAGVSSRKTGGIH